MKTTLKNVKLKDIIKNSSIDATLIRSLILWHGGLRSFCERVEDFSRYGASGGNSFCYTDDTNKFFRSHSLAIKNHYREVCYDFYDNDDIIGFFKTFQRLKSYSRHELESAFYNGKGDAVNELYFVLCVGLVEALANNIFDMTY